MTTTRVVVNTNYLKVQGRRVRFPKLSWLYAAPVTHFLKTCMQLAKSRPGMTFKLTAVVFMHGDSVSCYYRNSFHLFLLLSFPLLFSSSPQLSLTVTLQVCCVSSAASHPWLWPFACNVGDKQSESYFTVALTVNLSKLPCIPIFEIMSLLGVLIFPFLWKKLQCHTIIFDTANFHSGWSIFLYFLTTSSKAMFVSWSPFFTQVMCYLFHR